MFEIILGMLLPFVGTVLGSAMVFFIKNKLSLKLESLMLGFAGGVMIAASIWSLIIPAIEGSEHLNVLLFVPAVVGLVLGFGMMFLLGVLIKKNPEDVLNSGQKINKKMMIAIVVHNIPEGLAMGVALAGLFYGGFELTVVASLVFSVGMAVQNIPEGMVVSLPLNQAGISKQKAFWWGVLSGAVEPVCAVIAFLLAGAVSAVLPYVLALAGGAMIFVVVEEIIPESQRGEYSSFGMLGFVIGFLVMMILDVAF